MVVEKATCLCVFYTHMQISIFHWYWCWCWNHVCNYVFIRHWIGPSWVPERFLMTFPFWIRSNNRLYPNRLTIYTKKDNNRLAIARYIAALYPDNTQNVQHKCSLIYLLLIFVRARLKRSIKPRGCTRVCVRAFKAKTQWNRIFFFWIFDTYKYHHFFLLLLVIVVIITIAHAAKIICV